MQSGEQQIYINCILIWMFIWFCVYFLNKQITFYISEKEYNSIKEITKDQLFKINNYEIYKDNDTFMDNFSLSFLKLARFPYDYEEYFRISNKIFINWDIINYGNV